MPRAAVTPRKAADPQEQLVWAMDPREYGSEESRLAAIMQAIEEGATPNDVRVQRAWLAHHPSWIDASVCKAFQESLQAQPGLPIGKALKKGGSTRLELLLDKGLPPGDLGMALLEVDKKLPSRDLDLLSRTISMGFSPSPETVLDKILDVEDDPRALVLAKEGLLDPNAIIPKSAQNGETGGMSYAQAILLYGREVDLLRWLEVGADFSHPFPDGRTPATKMLLSGAPSRNPGACPIPEFRVKNLLQLSQVGLVDWVAEDSRGESGLQALRAMHHSDHRLWVQLERWANAQAMDARLPPTGTAARPARRF